jgi:hypothetical protein
VTGASTWLFALETVVFFLTAVVKLNPHPNMSEKMENMEFIIKNKEEGRKICKLLEKNTTIGQMRGMTKILM